LLTVQCSYKLLQLAETLCVEMDDYNREAHSTCSHSYRHFHDASWQHDFAGKGEYNVLRGVSKSDIYYEFETSQFLSASLYVSKRGAY